MWAAMQIGHIQLKNNIFMAPMAGVTDHVFRSIVHEHGAGLTFSEMISAKAITYKNKNTFRLLENASHIRPWAVQFFSCEPDVLSEAIKILDDYPYDIVDINMGCPMPKIVNNGEGSALMNNPILAGKLIEAAVKASKRPVTCKTRIGFTRQNINAKEMANIAYESGASMITIHGRTREQYYTGLADWDIISEVKACAKIPVIGNGDIDSPETAERRLKDMGGIMIARGAMGNPWIFSRTIEMLDTGVLPPSPTHNDIIAMALNHLGFSLKSGIRVIEMRKHLAWYTKGMPNSAQLRNAINKALTYDEIKYLLM